MKSASRVDDHHDAIILVVDDDRHLRSMAVETLLDERLATVGVESAEHALVSLRSLPNIRLLITDVNMPAMNGLELLRHVSREYPHLRRMIISGRAHLAPAEAPPHTVLLAKPFTAAQFVTCVRNLLRDSEELPPSR